LVIDAGYLALSGQTQFRKRGTVIDIDGPVPACDEPAGLLMSAEQGVGGLMASLDSYHLELVVAVLWHAGSGGSARNSSNDAAGQWL
jgi:hypothetical protein